MSVMLNKKSSFENEGEKSDMDGGEMIICKGIRARPD